MNDFRKELYKLYYSKFKVDYLNDKESDEKFYYFCNRNYSPCINDLKSDAHILELGCGSGRILNFLMQKGFSNIEGIDISKEQVELAVKKGYNAKAANAIQFLKGKSGLYDAIIAIDFIEHFHKDELIPLFTMVSRVLKNEGRLLIQTPNGKGIYPNRVIYGDLTHMTIFSDESLLQLLKLFDFKTIEFWEPRPAKYNIRSIIRLCLWNIIRLFANVYRKIEGGRWEKIWTQNLICLCKKEL